MTMMMMTAEKIKSNHWISQRMCSDKTLRRKRGVEESRASDRFARSQNSSTKVQIFWNEYHTKSSTTEQATPTKKNKVFCCCCSSIRFQSTTSTALFCAHLHFYESVRLLIANKWRSQYRNSDMIAKWSGVFWNITCTHTQAHTNFDSLWDLIT